MNSEILTVSRRLFKEGDSKHWAVAYFAYQCKNRKDVLEMADAISRTDDTVRNLSDAYSLFREFVLDNWRRGESSEPIRNLRRKFPYTRWGILYKQFVAHEFELSEAMDWLANFDGGNDAMSAEIENKHGAPEWQRRAYGLYKNAEKLTTDFGVPDNLQKAAVNYVKEYDIAFPKVKK